MKARVLIAEDEAPMRERLTEQLAEVWPQAEIVAWAENGLDAWEAYLSFEPDVVFLDIRMPGMSGLEVARRITGDAAHATPAPTRIVFVTAYDQFAIQAFDSGAVDYLLKPIQPERLGKCVRRLMQTQAPNPRLAEVLRRLQDNEPVPQRTRWIKAAVGRKIHLIDVHDVRFFQADAKYTRVVHTGGEALIRTPLKELVGSLDPEDFWQIHRSAVVRVQAIESAQRLDADRMEVLIKGSGERLPVSRAFFHRFKEP